MDAVERVALAVAIVIGMLVLLGEVDLSTQLEVIAGEGVYELLPVCVGIGMANALLRDEPDGDGANNSDSNDRNNASAVRFELDGVGESTPPATTAPATTPPATTPPATTPQATTPSNTGACQ
jgi:hypothetical protein